MAEPHTTLNHVHAARGRSGEVAGGVPAIHLIDEATCREAPGRAAWLADHLAQTPADRLVVIAPDHAPAARRLGLHADHLLRRRWPRLAPADRALKRWRRGLDGRFAAFDWSLRQSLRRSRSYLDAVSIHLPDDLPFKLDDRRLEAADREAIRTSWAVESGVHVAWLASDSVGTVDVMPAVAATGLAAEAGRPWALVIHPRMHGVARARRLVEAMGRGERLIVDERAHEPWRMAIAGDAALVLKPNAALAIRWVGRAGGDIVVTPEAQAALTAPAPAASSAARGRTIVSSDSRARSVADVLCRISERSLTAGPGADRSRPHPTPAGRAGERSA